MPVNMGKAKCSFVDVSQNERWDNEPEAACMMLRLNGHANTQCSDCRVDATAAAPFSMLRQEQVFGGQRQRARNAPLDTMAASQNIEALTQDNLSAAAREFAEGVTTQAK